MNSVNETILATLRSVAVVAIVGSLTALLFMWRGWEALAEDVKENKQKLVEAEKEQRAHEREDTERFHAIEKSLIRQEAIQRAIAEKVGAKVKNGE